MQAGGYHNSPNYKEENKKNSKSKQKLSLEIILDKIRILIKNQKPTGRLRKALDSASVDPKGWGISHNTQANREKNKRKSTEEIINEIRTRTKAGKPTYQLRQVLNTRSVDPNPYENETYD